MTTKAQLLEDGISLMMHWCKLNNVKPPTVAEYLGKPEFFNVCAYYRGGLISIWTNACSSIGMHGRLWSYPGYTVDRTPYGVIAHELGHHLDRAHGAAGGTYGREWRRRTRAKPISGYCDNDNEWFAEMFRVFVTNPELLKALRPTVFMRMEAAWPHRAETRGWREILDQRRIEVVEKRIHTPVGTLLSGR